MTYRQLIQVLKNMPEHYLDDTARVGVPVIDTDDMEIDVDVEAVDIVSGFARIKTEAALLSDI